MWDKWTNIYGELQKNLKKFGKFGGLRIWILCALKDGPKNGVEIMDAIQEKHDSMHRRYHHGNQGTFDRDPFRRGDMTYGNHHEHHRSWRPSPGSVYPMLKKMVEESLIVKREDGKYELADMGTEILDEMFNFRRGFSGQNGKFTAERALNEIDSYVSYLEDLKEEKLLPHKEEIDELSKRLKKIKESLVKHSVEVQ